MRHTLLIAVLIGFGFTGCNTPAPTPPKQTYEKPTAQKQKKYQETMIRVASTIKNDRYYKRITLDTPEKKAWFKALTYRLWDRQISRYQFISEGVAKYPTHKYEFEFVVRGFSQN